MVAADRGARRLRSGRYRKLNGKLYKSLIDGNVWSPDAYPQGWEEVTL